MIKRVSGRSRVRQSLYDRVATAIDSLRPALQTDGGDIELLDVDADGVVTVRLLGACIGCPSNPLTLSLGIERNLKDQISEVARVVCS